MKNQTAEQKPVAVGTTTQHTEDGGPAFPQEHRLDQFTGMSLRDYFAAKAMQAEVSTEGLEGRDVEFVANMSYERADALLTARKGTR